MPDDLARDVRSVRLPPWFRIRLASNSRSHRLERMVSENMLHTVCESAACPNKAECWKNGTATFMILGDVCTRGCRFCNVKKGVPLETDLDEPRRVAEAIRALALDYIVITSVTRDDLSDGGAGQFARLIAELRSRSPQTRVEVLIPDLQGNKAALQTIVNAHPDVLAHNIETVHSYYPLVRPQADYRRSLEMLTRAGEQGLVTKSGLMLGFGEDLSEIRTVLDDLRVAGCTILTLGQYLRPGKSHVPVKKYYHPDEFAMLKAYADSLGFRTISGPLVRSSYHASESGISAVR